MWGCTRLRLVSHGPKSKSRTDLIAVRSFASPVRRIVTLGVTQMCTLPLRPQMITYL